MYVIVKGSVSLKKMILTSTGKQIEDLLTCRYDGEFIGVVGMMQQDQGSDSSSLKTMETVEDLKRALQQERKKQMELEEEKDLNNKISIKEEIEDKKNQESKKSQKRLVTCQAEEKTYLLKIPLQYFREILMKMLQEELDKKLKVLMSLTMFKNFDGFTLIPLANILSIKEYSYGEIILDKGQQFPALFIVSSGRVRLIKKQIEYRSKQPSHHIQSLKPPLQKFNFSLLNKRKNSVQNIPNKYQKKKKKNSLSLHKYEIIEVKSNKKNKLHSFCQPPPEEFIQDIDGMAAYYNLVEYKNIGVGELIGTNTFLDLPFNQKLAQVTYIADSNQCELFYLEETNLKYLPDFLTKSLMDGLKFNTNEQELTNMINKDQSAQWIRQKQKIYEKELEFISSQKPSQNYFKKY